MKENVIGRAGNFNICFRDTTLSSHSGVLLVSEFANLLGVAELITEHLQIKSRKRGYTESESVLALVYNMILGGSCLSDLHVLRADEGSKQLLEMNEIIAPSTAGEFLRKFTIGDIWRLHRIQSLIQKKVRPMQEKSCCTLDLDGSIYEQCSRIKEGSKKTYNGKLGYISMFSFWAEEGELLFSHLLAGNRRVPTKAVWFVKETLKRLPIKSKKRLRADSEFYTWEFIEFCESSGICYAISADKSVQMMEKILKIEESIWKESKKYKETEVAEFRYQPTNQKERRYVVKREMAKDKKGKQYYRYHCVVTNDEEMEKEDLIEWYLQRARAENLIKEHKTGFSLEKLPTRSFIANWVYLLIGQLAFNLIVWFKKFALPKTYKDSTIKTIRYRILNLAGKIVSTGRKFFLVLSDRYKYQAVWKFALKQMAKLKPIFAYP